MGQIVPSSSGGSNHRGAVWRVVVEFLDAGWPLVTARVAQCSGASQTTTRGWLRRFRAEGLIPPGLPRPPKAVNRGGLLGRTPGERQEVQERIAVCRSQKQDAVTSWEVPRVTVTPFLRGYLG